MNTHVHTHTPDQWLFRDSDDTAVYCCNHVFDRSHPIRFVTHERDGDWQFLCGEANDHDTPHVVCFGCITARDASLFQLADLPLGWGADRPNVTTAWNREPLAERDDN